MVGFVGIFFRVFKFQRLLSIISALIPPSTSHILERKEKKTKERHVTEEVEEEEANRSSGGNKLLIWSCPWCCNSIQLAPPPLPPLPLPLPHPFILSSSGPVSLRASRFTLLLFPPLCSVCLHGSPADSSPGRFRCLRSLCPAKMRISGGLGAALSAGAS